MPNKVALDYDEEDEVEVKPEPVTETWQEEPTPNYRCLIVDSANVQSDCPDFYLPHRDLGPNGFVCPRCGNRKLIPLF